MADFYCAEKKLVIEVDGEYHHFQKEADINRDLILFELGITTLRIANKELMDVHAVLNKIKEKLKSLPATHPPAPSLLRKEGEVLHNEPKVGANPIPPSLRCREGVSELASDGGESVEENETKQPLENIHPPAPSLPSNEGKVLPNEPKVDANPIRPFLQPREGMSELTSDGGESLSLLLLAAGSSSRLGQSKQLIRLEGKSLLLRTTTISLEVCSQVAVVLGHAFEQHKSEIEHLPALIVQNHAWKNGMGRSLKTGFNSIIEKWPRTDQILILVCDQPFLTTNHLNRLIEMARISSKKIVYSSYKKNWGVPALFKKELFENLKQIEDGEGAKKLIQHLSGEVESVEFEGGEIDIDTPEDLKSLKR